jgi:hypothetical protein
VRRLAAALAVPGLVASLLMAGAGAAASDGAVGQGMQFRHPPRCC